MYSQNNLNLARRARAAMQWLGRARVGWLVGQSGEMEDAIKGRGDEWQRQKYKRERGAFRVVPPGLFGLSLLFALLSYYERVGCIFWLEGKFLGYYVTVEVVQMVKVDCCRVTFADLASFVMLQM